MMNAQKYQSHMAVTMIVFGFLIMPGLLPAAQPPCS